MFNKCLAPNIGRIETHGNKLICSDATLGTYRIRVINCHLPDDNGTHSDTYIDFLDKIYVVMD